MSISILALSSTVVADEVSYDYLELGYSYSRVSEFETGSDALRFVFDDKTRQGLAFEGSFSFADNYFTYIDFDFSSLDLGENIGDFLNSDPKVNIDTQVFGLGFHTRGQTQFVSKFGVLRQNIDSAFLKEATFGYEAELGGRGFLTDNLEWESNLNFSDPDLNAGSSGKLGVNASLRYHVTNSFATDFTASFKEGEKTYSLNFRYNFD